MFSDGAYSDPYQSRASNKLFALFYFVKEEEFIMNNPYTIEKVVLEILKANEEARNDDMKLYLLVCEAVNPFPTCDRDIGSFSFSSVMNHYRELRLPHFESVRRSRAKIQAEIPELAGDRSCRQRRKELEILYRNYATNKEE